ncbi:MAG: hypothetical protein FWD34_06185 [Oscillospiraceae bacterium]|nr:hypothetical protein [Oscillospiraceae bacterium]
MTKEEKDSINKLANELINLTNDNSEENASRITTIELEIATVIIGWFNRVSETGRVYYRNHKPIEAYYFWDIIFSEYARLILRKKYIPKSEGADFSTTLHILINFRVKTHFKKMKEKVIYEINKKDDDERVWEKVPDINKSGKEISENYEELEIALKVAELVYLKKSADKNKPITKRMNVEWFYTFDMTKLVKEDSECAKIAIYESGKLFKPMDKPLLMHLMKGRFSHMRDVVDNELRNPDDLKRWRITISECYGVSLPTVTDRKERYEEFLDACAVKIGTERLIKEKKPAECRT